MKSYTDKEIEEIRAAAKREVLEEAWAKVLAIENANPKTFTPDQLNVIGGVLNGLEDAA